MDDLTQMLHRIENGEPSASDDLLPLVYDQLRRLAEHHMQGHATSLTLQPTALVHEAYVRLVDQKNEPNWNHRGHFFAAAATAMRRILVERARRKRSDKGGGDRKFVPFDEMVANGESRPHDLIALDEALSALEEQKPDLAKLVSLRFFSGLTMDEAAKSLGISLRSAERQWSYAKAWLVTEMKHDG